MVPGGVFPTKHRISRKQAFLIHKVLIVRDFVCICSACRYSLLKLRWYWRKNERTVVTPALFTLLVASGFLRLGSSWVPCNLMWDIVWCASDSFPQILRSYWQSRLGKGVISSHGTSLKETRVSVSTPTPRHSWSQKLQMATQRWKSQKNLKTPSLHSPKTS